MSVVDAGIVPDDTAEFVSWRVRLAPFDGVKRWRYRLTIREVLFETIRHPDGTTTTQPPYTPAELRRVLLGPQARIWQEMTARRHAEAAARREQQGAAERRRPRVVRGVCMACGSAVLHGEHLRDDLAPCFGDPEQQEAGT